MPTYEMLWDCKFCGQKKLLGKSHRHCPSCGGAQDPESRYFPEEHEQVAVEDHEFVGADRKCPACGTAASASVKFCGGCGSPMDGAGSVALKDSGDVGYDEPQNANPQGSQPQSPPAGSPPPPQKSGGIGKIVVGAIEVMVVGFLGFVLVDAFYQVEIKVMAKAKTWEKTVSIEKLAPVRKSAWCNEMPRKAYQVDRTMKTRTRKVADGQECKNVRKDNGDGTFSTKQSCKTKYRNEEYQQAHCSYTVDRWKHARTRRANGNHSLTPHWPKYNISTSGRWPERLHSKKEIWEVKFGYSEGEIKECKLSENQWSGVKKGTSYPAKAGGLTGSLDCGSVLYR